jgi:hypothetical protein
MSLDDARNHLARAVRSLASGDEPLAVRAQAAWDEHVQLLWIKPCLTVELLRDFRDVWRRYTAPSDDRHSTTLRELSHEELIGLVDDLVSLLLGTAVAAAQPGEGAHLATLADLA